MGTDFFHTRDGILPHGRGVFPTLRRFPLQGEEFFHSTHVVGQQHLLLFYKLAMSSCWGKAHWLNV